MNEQEINIMVDELARQVAAASVEVAMWKARAVAAGWGQENQSANVEVEPSE